MDRCTSHVRPPCTTTPGISTSIVSSYGNTITDGISHRSDSDSNCTLTQVRLRQRLDSDNGLAISVRVQHLWESNQCQSLNTGWLTAVSETAHKGAPAPVNTPRTRCHVFPIYRTVLHPDICCSLLQNARTQSLDRYFIHHLHSDSVQVSVVALALLQ